MALLISLVCWQEWVEQREQLGLQSGVPTGAVTSLVASRLGLDIGPKSRYLGLPIDLAFP